MTEPKGLSKKAKWFVRLGRSEWMRFTYERAADDTLTLIGSVRRGASIGALATTSDGRYVQVNGDHISHLNAAQMRRLIERADKVETVPPRLPRFAAPLPVVVIKRRRRSGSGSTGPGK